MTNQQFLTTFEQHLNVGGPQREEIIAELRTHLDEQTADKLGDPKQLAKKSNRVHLGIFSSFRALLWTRLAIFLIFECGWLLIYLFWFVASPIQGNWLIYSINILAQTLPILAFSYGSYLIGHMRQRWIKIAVWSFTFAFGLLLINLLEQSLGYLLVDRGITQTSLFWSGLGELGSMYIVFGTISLGLMIATEGKNMIWPKHIVASTIFAFVMLSVASYFALPMIWNTITNYHYTEAMASWSEWIFEHQHYLAVIMGLIGAVLEWHRHTSTQKIRSY